MFPTIIIKAEDYSPIVKIDKTGKCYIRYNATAYEDGLMLCRSGVVRNGVHIKKVIEDDINENCAYLIENGHCISIGGTNYNVWLSSENQANYKAACDLAVQTNGENLPYTIRVGYSNDVKYVTFNTVEEILEFWKGCTEHIQKCLKECWEMKDSIDYSVYELPE